MPATPDGGYVIDDSVLFYPPDKRPKGDGKAATPDNGDNNG